MAEKRIMVIDDDPRNIFALAATLRAKGYTCESYTNAQEALDALSVSSPHVVLIDMMMPEMDGYEAIPKMRQLKGNENLPIIAVTAQAMMGDKEKCIAAGATDYIAKPIDVDKLLSLLQKHI